MEPALQYLEAQKIARTASLSVRVHSLEWLQACSSGADLVYWVASPVLWATRMIYNIYIYYNV